MATDGADLWGRCGGGWKGLAFDEDPPLDDHLETEVLQDPEQ